MNSPSQPYQSHRVTTCECFIVFLVIVLHHIKVSAKEDTGRKSMPELSLAPGETGAPAGVRSLASSWGACWSPHTHTRKLDASASEHSRDSQVQRVGGTPCPKPWANTVLISWPSDTRTPRGARSEDLDLCQDLSSRLQGPAVLKLQAKNTLGRTL